MCAMRSPRAAVLVNPIAGVGGRPEQGARMLRDALQAAGWEVDCAVVQGREAMTAHAAAAVDAGQDVVFVAGGDGSYRAAAQALAGTETALGPLPLGSRNVLARSIGLGPLPAGCKWTRAWARQAHRLARGQVVQVRDVGVLNGQVFLCWAGVGFDAAVVHRLERDRRGPRRQVVLRYALAVARALVHWPGFQVQEPPTPGRQWMWLVFKEPRYAGDLVRLRADARPDDGKLWVWRVPGRGATGLLRAAWAWIWGHGRGHTPYLEGFTGPQEWRLAAPQPVHLDGDPLFTTAVLQWNIWPRALKVFGMSKN